MNPIAEMLALSPAESVSIDVECPDGRTRKLLAHRPDESAFVRLHMDTTPALLIPSIHAGQRKGFDKAVTDGGDGWTVKIRYLQAAVLATMLVSGVGEKAEDITNSWTEKYINSLSLGDMLRMVLASNPQRKEEQE